MRIFISFVFAEKGLRNDLVQFFQPHGTIAAVPVFVSRDFTRQGDAVVKEEIRRVMSGCDALLTLVGENAHNSRWVGYENGVANSRSIPKAAIRHPNTSGGLPIAHQGMRVVDWSSTALMQLIQDWSRR